MYLEKSKVYLLLLVILVMAGCVKVGVIENRSFLFQGQESSPLVEYALEKGLDKDTALRLEEYLGGNLTEGKEEFIEILCEFNGSYVPEGIAGIVPEDYAFRLLENLRLRIIDSLAYDGNLSEDEMRALRVLLSLPKDVQRWYIEGEGLSGNTIYYLNFVDGLENESFRRFIFENMLCFTDGKLEEIEKEFLLNPDLYLKEIREIYSEKLEKIPGLKEQIEELPDYKLNSLKTVEALEDIAFLVERARPYEKFEDRFDPKKITPAREVYEGFELMLKGGKVKGGIVPYEVPEYNAQLYILWKLAESNEFKRHDTLVQSIALNEGFPYVIGDSEVKRKVVEDSRKWLKFLRETAEWQKANDLKFYLEDYPLEAKIALCDRLTNYLIILEGSKNFRFYKIYNKPDFEFWKRPIKLESYEWYWLDEFENLKKCRKILFSESKDLIKKSSTKDIGIYFDSITFLSANLAESKSDFYSKNNFLSQSKWKVPDYREAGKGGKLTLQDEINYVIKKYGNIKINGRKVPIVSIRNIDFQVDHFINYGFGFGNCGDYVDLACGISKSIGIPTMKANDHLEVCDQHLYGHLYPLYFDSKTLKWFAHVSQPLWKVKSPEFFKKKNAKLITVVHRMPSNLKRIISEKNLKNYKIDYRLGIISITNKRDENKRIGTEGIATERIKKFLYYRKLSDNLFKIPVKKDFMLDGIIDSNLSSVYNDSDDYQINDPSADILSVYIGKTNNSYYFGIKTLQPPDTKKYMYYIGIDVDEDLKKDYIVNIDSSDVKLYKMIKENPLLIYETRPYIKRDIEFTIPAEYLEEPKAIFAGSYDIKKEKCIDCNPWKFLNE